MNSSIKKLGTLLLGGFLAGSAFAGPAGVYSNGGFASQTLGSTPQPSVTLIALFRSGAQGTQNCPMIKEQSKQVPLGTSKGKGTVKVVTGYKHENCVRNGKGAVVCKGTDKSCSHMLQGH